MDHFNTTKGLRKGILVYTRYLKTKDLKEL
jgi:hypothetical protein